MILTDISISQSELWQERTDLIAEIDRSLIKGYLRLPKRLQIHSKPFVASIILMRKMWRYRVIVTADLKTAQLIAFVRKVLCLRRPKHIVLELMLDGESNTMRWKIKRALQRFLFSSVDLIFVSSSEEVGIYSKRLLLPPDRFRFVHFHTNITHPEMYFTPNSYILSAGKTGRDFPTLVEAARRLESKTFIIVSDKQNAIGLNLPRNVILYIDIPRKQYLKLLKECSFAVVPLQPLASSTGQVVFLEAMGLGKPVIATDAVGTRDYIMSGFNGMLVPPNDPSSLAEAIRLLADDPSLHQMLSRNALNFVQENCTFTVYVKKILDTASALCLT